MPIVDHITIIQALLIGIIAGISIVSWIYSLGYAMRALIMSALVGLILGHAKEGLMFGAAAELIFLGLINAAGVVPPSPVGPGIFGVVIYLTSPGMSIGAAITLSIPFAVFVQFLNTIIFTVVAPVGKLEQDLIKKGKFGLYMMFAQSTAILLFIQGLILGIGVGVGYAAFEKDIINKIPVWLQKGLGVAGSMLPAMGFAVVLRLMLKKEYIPFLLLGFTLVVIFTAVGSAEPQWGFSLVSLAIAATAIALIVFNSGLLSKKEKTRRQMAPVVEGEEDGI